VKKRGGEKGGRGGEGRLVKVLREIMEKLGSGRGLV
jgi:hypothetical protein